MHCRLDASLEIIGLLILFYYSPRSLRAPARKRKIGCELQLAAKHPKAKPCLQFHPSSIPSTSPQKKALPQKTALNNRSRHHKKNYFYN